MKTAPISYLRDALTYDPQTGALTWKSRPRDHFNSDRGWRTFNTRFANRPAGTRSTTTGYIVLNFNVGGGGYGMMVAHRIAFALHHGRWAAFVDHVNGDRSDNRAVNLRECTKAQNLWNRGAQANNTSGHKGVHFSTQAQRWQAQLVANGKRYRLGNFLTPAAAAEAYERAAQLHHGEFANSG